MTGHVKPLCDSPETICHTAATPLLNEFLMSMRKGFTASRNQSEALKTLLSKPLIKKKCFCFHGQEDTGLCLLPKQLSQTAKSTYKHPQRQILHLC